MSIRELDDDTVRRIAAGEVIERPASVVKELVENSLDADAGRIDVAVEAGGTERIRVADDGVGMGPDEVRTAVREHTTSKIGDADDLRAVDTLGFRGEALHAIGAVSKTTITTRPRGGDRATELRVEHGEVVAVEPAGRPEGTTVDVTDLFARTPARRRFLKAEATEFDHVNRIVARYALANPDVAVSLLHDDREVFATAGRGDLREALLAVYGREVAEAMLPVEGEGVSGYVSHPETTRSTREYLSTYVNGRYVRSADLRGAVLDAYGDQLASDRYPFAALFVDVPPDEVDVNVHPRKLEVRFGDGAAVRERVRAAVEDALLEHGLLRSGAPRGASTPEEAEIDPGSVDGGAAGDLADDGTPADGSADPEPATTSDPAADGASETADASPEADAGSDPAAPGPDLDGAPDRPSTTFDPDDAPATEPSFRSAGTQTTLDARTVEDAPGFDRLPSMRILGQLRDTYVVAGTDDGLVLIDQHAADERINYERLRERVGDDPAVQALAEPATIELTAREAELFPEYRDALEAAGFRAERTGDRAVTVHAVPAVFADAFDPSLLRDLLSEFLDGADATSVESRTDDLLADLACYPSITGNTSLTEGSVRGLLEALDDCENPYACPHGRPVVVEIGADELDERFERDYPGHPGRRGDP